MAESTPIGAMDTTNVLPDERKYPSFLAFVKKNKKPKRKKRRKIITEANQLVTHIEHLEDITLYNVSKFKKLVETILTSNADITLKYDGYPALIFGKKYGKFFIGLKGVDTTNKFIYSISDIQKYYSDKPKDLIDKLTDAYNLLSKYNFKDNIAFASEVIFTDKIKSISNNKIHFKPNVVSYEVDKSSTIFNKINSSKLGLIVHSEYDITENGFISTELVIPTDMLNIPNVYIQEVEEYNDIKFDSVKIKSILSQLIADTRVSNIKDTFKFINYAIVKNANFFDTNKMKELLTTYNTENKTSINIPDNVFTNYKLALQIKQLLLSKLHSENTIIKPSTKHEGYVIFTDIGIVKIINRTDYLKGKHVD